MKGHILSIFGYLVLQFTYHSILLGFFFSLSPFHFFCAHCGLSFARMQVRVGIFVLVWRFRDFSFLFHILETEGRRLMHGLALNWLVLGDYATLDWRGRRKDCKKIAVVMGRKQQKRRKRRRSHFSLFSPSSILLDISLPPIVLYHTVSFAWLQPFSIFSIFFLSFFSLGNKHVELAMV